MPVGLTSLLNTAQQALSAQAYGVTVSGQNITNVNTEGYARREAILQTQALGGESYGGVQVLGLRQITDQYLERGQLTAIGQHAAANQQDLELGSVEALFNDEAGAGLGNQLDQLYNSFGELATNPNDTTARGQILNNAELFANDVSSIADQLASTRSDLLNKAKQIVTEINERAGEISSLNRRIQQAEAQGQDAADLKDLRAQALLDLAKSIDVKTTIDGNGGIVVHSAGTVLVEGANARSLSIDLDDSGGIQLLASFGSGNDGTDITRHLTGGALAGVKQARDVDLFAVATELDEFAFDVATAINDQHALGFGRDGVGGRNLFDVSSGPEGAARSLSLSADVAGNPDAVAAALSAGTVPGGAGNAVALAALADEPIGAGSQTATERYADIVGDVASRKSTAARAAEMRGALEAQSRAMRESVSGVSLDEEMISLTKYQRGYEAAAKILSAVDEMFQELLARVG
jgi:flagellar hook-associated protein 1